MHLSREAIGERLQEERKRTGLNQDDFAKQVGIAKRTLAGYEGGAGDVGAAVLAKAAELGVDVLYIVTGERKPQPASSITAEESELLKNFRRLTDAERGYTGNMVAGLAILSDPAARFFEGKKG